MKTGDLWWLSMYSKLECEVAVWRMVCIRHLTCPLSIGSGRCEFLDMAGSWMWMEINWGVGKTPAKAWARLVLLEVWSGSVGGSRDDDLGRVLERKHCQARLCQLPFANSFFFFLANKLRVISSPHSTLTYCPPFPTHSGKEEKDKLHTRELTYTKEGNKESTQQEKTIHFILKRVGASFLVRFSSSKQSREHNIFGCKRYICI